MGLICPIHRGSTSTFTIDIDGERISFCFLCIQDFLRENTPEVIKVFVKALCGGSKC